MSFIGFPLLKHSLEDLQFRKKEIVNSIWSNLGKKKDLASSPFRLLRIGTNYATSSL